MTTCSHRYDMLEQVLLSQSWRLNLHHMKQMQLARRILDKEYTTAITIEQLSREIALSPYYLIRLFRSVYKQTPHQYLIQLRIKKAKDLLINSNLSVTEICAVVGYESLGSFSALFYKTVGVSPSIYRANSQAIQKSTYIPLCTCFRHGLHDTPDS